MRLGVCEPWNSWGTNFNIEKTMFFCKLSIWSSTSYSLSSQLYYLYTVANVRDVVLGRRIHRSRHFSLYQILNFKILNHTDHTKKKIWKILTAQKLIHIFRLWLWAQKEVALENCTLHMWNLWMIFERVKYVHDTNTLSLGLFTTIFCMIRLLWCCLRFAWILVLICSWVDWNVPIDWWNEDE